MSLASWTLRGKILLGQGFILLLLAILLIVAFVRLDRLGRASASILTENYRSILAAENMIDALERQDSAVLLLTLGHAAEGVEQFRTNERRFLTWLERAQNNITIQGEVAILERIDDGFQAYVGAFSEFERLPAEVREDGGVQYHQVMFPIFLRVRDACTQLREINEEAMLEASRHAEVVAHRGMTSLAVFGGVTVLLGIVFSLFVATLLTRPLEELVDATQRLARGDYDVTVPPPSTDELRVLTSEFNVMVAQLRTYRDLNVKKLVVEKQRTEAVLGSIEDGILLLDEEISVRRMNPSAERILGLSEEDARRRPLGQVLRDAKVLEDVTRQIRGEKPSPESEGPVLLERSIDGEPRYFDFSVTPVTLGSRSRLGFVLVLRDVTELQRLDRLKDQLVMTASHEFRTPLTSIGMSLDLLDERGETFGPQARELLSAAREDVQRLRRLVDALLDLSKIRSGKLKMTMGRIAVEDILARLWRGFQVQFEERGVELDVELSDSSLHVWGDREKIESALSNLLSNALRHTPKGGRVEVGAEPAGAFVAFSVGDNGPGIAVADQSRIFDEFVQADAERAAGGTGLGLSISREIVRAHGGTIWVDSHPGEGSIFTFTLPAARSNEENTKGEPPWPREDGEPSSSSTTRRTSG